jgi:hypothetical protein
MSDDMKNILMILALTAAGAIGGLFGAAALAPQKANPPFRTAGFPDSPYIVNYDIAVENSDTKAKYAWCVGAPAGGSLGLVAGISIAWSVDRKKRNRKGTV